MKPLHKQIYDGYLKGEILTTITAREQFHTTELRSINNKIKKIYGVAISFKWIENAGKRYKQYFLVKQEKQLEMFI